MAHQGISDRRPINFLYGALKYIAPQLEQELSQYDVDMYREFRGCSLETAAGFYYIEHLIRATTPDRDFEEAEDFLLGKEVKFLKEMTRKQNYVFESLVMLQAEFDSYVSRKLPPMQLEIFSLTNSEFRHQSIQPGEGGRWPFGYFLITEKRLFSLYTVGMTLVDCFDPITGARSYPLLTKQLLENITSTLYKQTKTRSVGTQTNLEKSKPSHVLLKPRKVHAKLHSDVPPDFPTPFTSTNPSSPQRISAMSKSAELSIDLCRESVSKLERFRSPSISIIPSDHSNENSFTQSMNLSFDTPRNPSNGAVISPPLTWKQYAETISERRRDKCIELSSCRLL